MAKSKTRRRLEAMRESNIRNAEREREHFERMWIERHMRDRLAMVRAMDVPAAVEPVRQEIIERYEHDLATWAG